MKILVCGDRRWKNFDVIFRWLKKQKELATARGEKLEVINGAAPGADELSTRVCRHLDIPVDEVPAEWDKYGKAAGPIRNTTMLHKKPDRVFAFHDDIRGSKGTKNMAKQAMASRLQVTNIKSDGSGQILPDSFFVMA